MNPQLEMLMAREEVMNGVLNIVRDYDHVLGRHDIEELTERILDLVCEQFPAAS